MNKAEAIAVLRKNGYCSVHGCKLITPGHEQLFEGKAFCGACRREELLKSTDDVRKAKAVLNLK